MRLATLWKTFTTSNRQLGLIAVTVLGLMAFSVSAFAQAENGQISGRVTDPQGAVVSGATVTATSAERQTKRTTATSGTGDYTLTALAPGKWELAVQAPAFGVAKQAVIVAVGSRNVLDFKLAVTGTTTTVEVVSEGALQVDTQSPEVSQVIGSKQVTELPTLTRNPYDLVSTAGNVQEQEGGARGVGFALNGQRSASTGILLDGAENVDTFTATVGQSIPLDAVQEFRVITNNFGAEYGRASGGIVNVLTKSGTNNFHGTVYEFNRLSAYTSNTFDNGANNLPKGKYTRNQFGYSIGGPIVKNKLFFFNSTEWQRVRSSAPAFATIPDPALIAAANANTQAFFSAFGKKRAGLQTVKVLTVGQTAGTLCATTACAAFSALPAGTPAFDVVSYAVPSDAGGGLQRTTSTRL